MKGAILFALAIFCFLSSGGQVRDSLISVREGFLGPKFYSSSGRLNYRQAASRMEANPLAYAQLKQGRRAYAWSNILALPGGVLLGYSLARIPFADRPDWHLITAGAGLSTASIVLLSQSRKRSREAADLYNEGLRKTGVLRPKLELHTGDGVGLVWRF